MTGWVDDDVVDGALKSKDYSALVVAGVPFCVSEDGCYCVLAREHSAWQVPNKGWRDSNCPPPSGTHGRLALNFFKRQVGDDCGYWFKLLIPRREGRVQAIRQVGAFCHVCTDASELSFAFARLDDLVWDLMSGDAQAEDELERLYSLLGNV